MSPTLEAAFAAGIALSSVLSGAALANSIHIKRSAVAKARRVAAGTVKDSIGHWAKGLESDVRRLERDELILNRVMNIHGLMRGRLIVPAVDGVKIHRFETGPDEPQTSAA